MRLFAGLLAFVAAASAQGLKFEKLGTFTTGIFDQGAAEIVAFDPGTKRLFLVNGSSRSIDVLDATRPASVGRVMRLTVPEGFGRAPNSVAIRNGIVAVAIEAAPKTDPGSVAFYQATDGKLLSVVRVGAQPDMVLFSPDGSKVLTADEGEPSDDYAVDPKGSVSVIDVSGGFEGLTQAKVSTLDFTQYNTEKLDAAIRVFGPNATPAQDFEPEYIAISADSKTAYITLQEANAIAVLNLDTKRFVRLMPLGFKDHSLPGNGLDVSDRDNKINIANWPILGMYQPDAIATFVNNGTRYLVTANEGDTRGWSGYNEEVRVSTLTLDPVKFPNAAALKLNENLGRLTVTRAGGDTDGDGDVDRILVFGGRSFTIFSEDGKVVFDSGDAIEKLMAERFPLYFNSDATGGLDTRSDNKGPEPEGLTVAELQGRRYVFVGLERMSGVVIYDITDPVKPTFVEYVHNRIFTGNASAGTGGDHGPEGLIVIPALESPTGEPLLAVANEVSGSTTLYRIVLPALPLAAKVTPSAVTTVSSEVLLDASTSEGAIASYSWKSVGRSAAIIKRDSAGKRVSIQFGQGFGEYIIELTVTDAAGNKNTTSAKIFNAGY